MFNYEDSMDEKSKCKEWSSKDEKFTTIEISEADKQRLFTCAMKIKEYHCDKEPVLPYQIVRFAVDALEVEIDIFTNKDNKTEVSSKTVN